MATCDFWQRGSNDKAVNLQWLKGGDIPKSSENV